MAGMKSQYDSEIEQVIANRRLAERVEACALLAFAPEELAAMPAEQRSVLDMLIKRYLNRAGDTPEVGDCLRLRQQFEQFCERQTGGSDSFRLAAQLR